ncbi:hypothetical protein PAEPH01_1726 [Pancytospora epiphaga]|nr:hypothetical protein PAEPH01_1726 [Pancytospora epiphaga]
MPKGDIDFIFMIEGLKELEIENCNLKEGCLENIHRLKSLERLNIGRNAINKSDMDAIVSIKVLRELRMSYCDVTDNVAFLNIKCLNNSLMLFDASGCSLSKENMSKLVNLTNLRELRLVSKLSVDILSKVLSKLTRLRALYLGPIDTRKFIASRCFPLMSLSTLEILELDFINIKNEFIEWLGRLPNLKELAFECTSIPHKDEIPIFNIAEFPRSLRKLKITGNRCYSLNFNASGKQDGLVIFENLEELCFHNTCDISEELINKIASCFKLRTFEISIKSTSENFQNIEIKGIERIATLEGLVLKGIDLTSENGIQFSSCKQLHTLKLSFCQVNDKSLYRIENLKFLKTLDVLYLKKKTS